MSIRNLAKFFTPHSIAVVGASDQAQSIGATVMGNLLSAGFGGQIHPINPNHARIAGFATAPNVTALDVIPDLAVVCSPPQTVPGVIAELGQKGTKAAVVITSGLGSSATPGSLSRAMLEAARPHMLRILGPNCLGLLVPALGLNASFAPTNALPGKLAFVTQSGALATAVLDWGTSRGIGFSSFISIGDSADVDLGDLLDYLGSDANTSAILLYIESIKAARKFMSAARGAARAKPVIVVKAGRAEEGARAAASHTGALAGSDEIIDAALRRAGVLRVTTMRELFDAAETLARAKPITGRQLAIMTNGGGAGVLATDALIAGGGELAALAPNTIEQLNVALPATWSHANPIDIIGDAPAARYTRTLEILSQAKELDAILLLHAPTAIVPSLTIAKNLAPVIKGSGKNVLTCFIGENSVHDARQHFAEHEIASYETPEDAVLAFLHMADFYRNQELLLETPASLSGDVKIDTNLARTIIAQALAQQRSLLTEVESKQLLAAYGIPVVATQMADSADGAVAVAKSMGFPVALKILSPDITHKSDVGGVALHLNSDTEVQDAALAMLRRVQTNAPHAKITGFTVQQMIRTGQAFELILGSVSDPIFGPVIMFGQGGTAVELLKDRSFALPPLNTTLVRELIGRTRIAKLLAGYRDRPAVNEQALISGLIGLSQLICDLPEIVELDINPLLADEQGVLALDARVVVAPSAMAAAEARLAIRPYPQQLEEHIEWAGASALLRPIRPEDEPQHAEFLQSLAPEDVYFRFFHTIRNWSHKQLARLTQIDYDREMAIVATQFAPDGKMQIMGVVRTVTDPDNIRAEFAVVVRSTLKGKGLGRTLMQKIIQYSRERGTKQLFGYVLANNTAMLGLARALGFNVMAGDDPQSVEVILDLEH